MIRYLKRRRNQRIYHIRLKDLRDLLLIDAGTILLLFLLALLVLPQVPLELRDPIWGEVFITVVERKKSSLMMVMKFITTQIKNQKGQKIRMTHLSKSAIVLLLVCERNLINV